MTRQSVSILVCAVTLCASDRRMDPVRRTAPLQDRVTFPAGRRTTLSTAQSRDFTVDPIPLMW